MAPRRDVRVSQDPPTAVVAAPSAQERTIVGLLAQGYTDEVVARRIELPRRTYRRRVSSLMEKLGARSRFQAGVLAAQAGWLDDSAD